MAKLFILYNLAPNVTDDQYQEYVKKEKGPLFDSLAAMKKFELTKTADTPYGKSPYKYIGVLHLSSLDDYLKKDVPKPEFQDFYKKWKTMVSDVQMWYGEEIYPA